MASLNMITTRQLNRLVGTPECPVVVDVCTDEDFAAAPMMVPGAMRHPHHDVEGLATKLAGRASVIACQKGKKLSQGVAAWLRARGLKSEVLEGGMLAWQADPDTANLPASALPGSRSWVTRQRPKIDRIACPWLIRRFVDRDAQVLFVAPTEVADVAARFDATAFDAEGAHFTHKGRGCTFDHMLDHFGLRSAALDRLADVIRAADLGNADAVPEARGLLALSIGLSRQYRDDNQQLEAGMQLYDALYRWARDGSDERHGSDFGDAA